MIVSEHHNWRSAVGALAAETTTAVDELHARALEVVETAALDLDDERRVRTADSELAWRSIAIQRELIEGLTLELRGVTRRGFWGRLRWLVRGR